MICLSHFTSQGDSVSSKGEKLNLSAPIDKINLHLRQGSIIPTQVFHFIWTYSVSLPFMDSKHKGCDVCSHLAYCVAVLLTRIKYFKYSPSMWFSHKIGEFHSNYIDIVC